MIKGSFSSVRTCILLRSHVKLPPLLASTYTLYVVVIGLQARLIVVLHHLNGLKFLKTTIYIVYKYFYIRSYVYPYCTYILAIFL